MARNTTYVDPLFHLPEEVKDFAPSDLDANNNTPLVPSSSPISYAPGGDSPFRETESATPYVELPVVENIFVVEQILKISPDGNHTIDLIVEVVDYPGISSYEIRVTPA